MEKAKNILLIVGVLLFTLPWLTLLVDLIFNFVDIEYLVAIAGTASLAGFSLSFATMMIFEILEG